VHSSSLSRSWLARLQIAAFHRLGAICLARFERRTRHAVAVNRRTLAAILRRNATTWFGRSHHFATLRDGPELITRYQSAVPLSTYPDYEAAVSRIANGEQNILSSETVTLLARSAGTTGRSKRIPRTRRAQGHHLGLVVLAAQAVIDRAIPALRAGPRGINLMSMHAPPAPAGSLLVEMSGPNAGLRRGRRLIPLLYTSPLPVFAIADPETAGYLHALFALQARDAAFIDTPFASQVVGFCALMERHQASLVADLHAGSLAPHLHLSPAERQSLQRLRQPDPDRARAVATAFAAGPAGLLRRLWPAMACIRTVTSGSFALSVPRLRWLAGPEVLLHSPCYTASEGIIGINLRADGSTDYVLAVGTAFFEFIPLAQADEPQPTTVTLGALEIGSDYEVVMTTTAGLYRYRLGDVIRITGFHHSAPTFLYRYRRGLLINLVNEKTSEYHTAAALSQTLERWLGQAGAAHEYSVAAEFQDGIGQYTFYVELQGSLTVSNHDLPAAARLLDDALGDANEFYRLNGRAAQRLAPAQLKLVRPGAFAALGQLQLSRSGGLTPLQIKSPRVVRDTEQRQLLEAHVVSRG
jgi:hypothetical protein